MKFLLKIQWIFLILLSFFVIRNFRGTCSSVEILKGSEKGWEPLTCTVKTQRDALTFSDLMRFQYGFKIFTVVSMKRKKRHSNYN